MSNEIWKDIEGYSGIYRVSNLGRVISYNRNKEGVFLTPCDNNNGYQYVSLGRGVENRRYIHRLVATHFLPNPNNLPEVNHKDENKTNNMIWVNEDGSIDYNKSNLEWCTHKYNINYGSHNDRLCKPVDQYTKNGEFIKTWRSIKDAESFYGVTHIWDCCVGRRKKCGGYIWKYNNKEQGHISPQDILKQLADLLDENKTDKELENDYIGNLE